MFLLTALLTFAAAIGSVTDCNTASIFRPTMLALTPDPPVVGAPVLMTVLFDNPGPAISGTGGIVTTSVTLNGLPFAPTSEDLCQNTACPFVQGANDRSTSSTWPDARGKIVSKSVWTSVEGETLLCVLTTVKVGSSNLRLKPSSLNGTLFRDNIRLKQVIQWPAFVFNRICTEEEYINRAMLKRCVNRS